MRLALVEDHPLYRDALVRGLRSASYEVVLAVGSLAELPADTSVLCRAIDLLVVDVELPDGSGVDLARRVVSTCQSRVPVVVLSSHDDARTVSEVQAAGCSAFVSKAVALEELVEVLRSVALGRVSFPAVDTTHVSPGHLSSRELDCLTLVAEGFSNREIAETLGVSRETVKTTLDNARNKLGANDRAHAVALALEHNMLKRRT